MMNIIKPALRTLLPAMTLRATMTAFASYSGDEGLFGNTVPFDANTMLSIQPE